MMTIREAATQARKSAHGCRDHHDAMNVLFREHRKALNPVGFVELEALWAWVDGYLQMGEASYGPTPLG